MADEEQVRQETAPRSGEVPASETGALGPDALARALGETAKGEGSVFASETRLLAKRLEENGGTPADAAELEPIDEEVNAALYDFNQEVAGIMRGQDAQAEAQESWRASSQEAPAAEPENLRPASPSMMVRALADKPRPEVARTEAAAKRVEAWQALTKAEAALQARYDQQMQKLLVEASTARGAGTENDQALNETLRQLNEVRASKRSLVEMSRVADGGTAVAETAADGGGWLPAEKPTGNTPETMPWTPGGNAEDAGATPHPNEAALPEDERDAIAAMPTVPSQPNPGAVAGIYDLPIPKAPRVPQDLTASLRPGVEAARGNPFLAGAPEWPADDVDRIAELEAKIRTREDMGLDDGSSFQLKEMKEELARLKAEMPDEQSEESVMPIKSAEISYPEEDGASLESVRASSLMAGEAARQAALDRGESAEAAAREERRARLSALEDEIAQRERLIADADPHSADEAAVATLRKGIRLRQAERARLLEESGEPAEEEIGTADTLPPPAPPETGAPRPTMRSAEMPSGTESEDEIQDLPDELSNRLGDWLAEDGVSDWKPLAELEQSGDTAALAERLKPKNLERELDYLRRGLDLHQEAVSHLKTSELESFQETQLNPLARRAHDIVKRLAKTK